MQLNINTNFSSQINALKGKQFELIVSACYYYLGYSVFRNIKVLIQKQTAAEIDVIASLITPLHEIIIAIECKGATPRFNDLRKFSTIKKILGHGDLNVNLFAYGAEDIRKPHLEFAKFLGINLHKKSDLNKKILPILFGTGELRSESCFSNRRTFH